MAPSEDRPDSAMDTGAEFEENQPGENQKVVVNTRPRVAAPGAAPATRSKATIVKPDATEQELKPTDDTADANPASDQAAVDELAKQAADKKNQQSGADNTAQQKHAQDLVEAKTYFVPIGQVTKRRHTVMLVVVGLALVVGAVAAFFMFS